MLKDCTNYGKVTSDGGRCGNISGACVKVQTGGQYPDDWAEAAEPMSDGSNVFGRVTDVTGKAVAGVVGQRWLPKCPDRRIWLLFHEERLVCGQIRPNLVPC